MLTPCHAHGAAVLNGHIYVTGGATPAIVKTVQVYTPETNSWQYCAPMSRNRYAHSVIFIIRVNH